MIYDEHMFGMNKGPDADKVAITNLEKQLSTVLMGMRWLQGEKGENPNSRLSQELQSLSITLNGRPYVISADTVEDGTEIPTTVTFRVHPPTSATVDRKQNAVYVITARLNNKGAWEMSHVLNAN